MAGFIAIAAFYFRNLTGYLINDDEGSYLYAAWRISRGELPYVDFLTPQLPAFLLPGGLLFRLVGPNVWAARALAVGLTLAAGVLVWLAARRLFGSMTALVAGAALLLSPDVVLDLRTFRAEPFMLAFASAGIAALAWAMPAPEEPVQGATGSGTTDRTAAAPRRRWLIVAGAAFGLATLSKLFGPFVLAGCLAWLAHDAIVRRRGARDSLIALMLLGGTAAGVAAAGLAAFSLVGAPIFADVIGHHLAQGASLEPTGVLVKGLWFLLDYLRYHPVLVSLAVAGAVLAARSGDRRALLFAWQLPTALGLLALSRDLYPRHLAYLIPATGTLLAFLLGELAGWRSRPMPARAAAPREGQGSQAATGLVTGAILAALFVPWILLDRDLTWRKEDGTRRTADVIRLLTEPDDLVVSDYSELNFYALRPTTYSAASLSAGAAASGQITWARIRTELDKAGQPGPKLVLVDRTEVGGRQYGHLRFLRDLSDFEAWLDESYQHVGTITRRVEVPDRQLLEAYVPRDSALPLVARYRGGPTLVAADWPQTPASPGGGLPVTLVWRADGASAAALYVTARLVDQAGRAWAQADGLLLAGGERPTTAWTAGELTASEMVLSLRPGTPPGAYSLAVGVYTQPGGASLPTVTAGGAEGPALVQIGGIEVPADTRSSAPEDLVAGGARPGETIGPLTLIAASQPPSSAVTPGAEIPLELAWRLKEPVASDLSLRVSVGASAGAGEPSAIGMPGHGTSTWAPGTVALSRVSATVPATAAVGSLPIWLEVVDGRRAVAAPITLGEVAVGQATAEGRLTILPQVDLVLTATFGTAIELSGARLGEPPPYLWKAGSTHAVELVWRAVAVIPERYKVTLQLIGPDGRPVAQDDAEPGQWNRPTSGWVPGEYVLDTHVLNLPQGATPGGYHLVAGVYRTDSAARLPAGGTPDGLARIVDVEVMR